MDLPKRKSNRLNEYDYSTPGAYFITICVRDKKELLGKINVGFGACDEPEIQLSSYGLVVKKYIDLMNTKYDDISIDKYVIMPNHIHLIIIIENRESVHGIAANAGDVLPSRTNARIPKFISLLKRYCNREYSENIFQRSFHDHIIRDENDYRKIWEYIDTNPAKWQDGVVT